MLPDDESPVDVAALPRRAAKIPASVKRFRRHEAREWDRLEIERIRKQLDAYEAVLRDPDATDEDRRLARIELVGMSFRPNGDEDAD
jgi:hypothetical protein